MNRPVIILGAGGHAKVLVDALQLSGKIILGLVDRDKAKHGIDVLGVPVLGGEDMLDAYPPNEVKLVNALGSVRSMEVRKKVYQQFKKAGYIFSQVIHPSAVVSPHAELGEGVQVIAGAVVMPGCRVGENTILNTRSSIDHDCRIGAHVHIAPGAVLSGNVVVGHETHIGTGASVIQGCVVGRGALVAAGAVVVGEVPECGSVRGVPAKAVQS